jgi:serine/threonine protein kinase
MAFKIGTEIPLVGGGMAKVQDKLGEGGQGAVYKVKVGGEDYALKWYHAKAISKPDAFYKNLENNINKGAPSGAFLWPIYLTEKKDGRFGYVMNLRKGDYREFGEFMVGRPQVRFGSILAAINACLNISNGFAKLHGKGFSYQDLNDGNFFIDPKTGAVLICDNDNVAPWGTALGIAGKARYMAPEVVRNLAKPDTLTDRFSLAVILFRFLFLDHPLEGTRLTAQPCMTSDFELKFFGKEPIFIYDKSGANPPDPKCHPNVIRFWPLFPSFIRDKFALAFSKEAMAREKEGGNLSQPPRITSYQWEEIFNQLRGMLITCPCGSETFVPHDQEYSICINSKCGQKIPRPSILDHRDYKVTLFPGQKIYLCHTDGNNQAEGYFTTVCGEVIRNTKNPQIWGLKNLGERTWTATGTDDAPKQVGPGEVAVILKTKSIDFGNGHVTIKNQN